MRYGTWNMFLSNPKEGTNPPKAETAFELLDRTSVGYLSDDADVSSYSDWDCKEISFEEFTALLYEINPKAKIKNGKLDLPKSNDPDFNLDNL